jgi:hypothetical protein
MRFWYYNQIYPLLLYHLGSPATHQLCLLHLEDEETELAYISLPKIPFCSNTEPPNIRSMISTLIT